MLSGVIYVHRISDRRFTGIAGRNFKMVRELCGDMALKNVVLVTNMWGSVPSEVGENREKELSSRFFKQVLEKGAQMVRHLGTTETAHGVIRKIAMKSPVALQIQQELVDEHRDLIHTAAGRAVNQELAEQMRQHQAELQKVREDMAEALKEKDEQTREELEEETRRLWKQMGKIKRDSEGMVANYAAEKERMENRVMAMERQVGERGVRVRV